MSPTLTAVPSSEVRVLLVDDNPDDVSIIRRLLEQYQRATFKVVAAGSTKTCLEFLAGERVDLLLLDYMLPAEDGLTFLRRAASIVDLPPVVVVTGQGDHRLAAEAIRSGAADCIQKSAMTSQTLGQTLQKALAKFRHEEDISRFDQNIVFALIETANRVDPTAGSERMADLASGLGGALSLNDYQIGLLREGALLHDVGKLGVRRELLYKPSRLSRDEQEEMRYHPLIGERLCQPLRLSRELSPIIRHHHERWDGRGYVDGLAGQEIPLLARIIGVVDSYDAMTTNRPYRAALETDEAVKRLEDGAGSQWDPELIEIFVDLIKKDGSLVRPQELDKAA
jgi:putative two-component system response regulator